MKELLVSLGQEFKESILGLWKKITDHPPKFLP